MSAIPTRICLEGYRRAGVSGAAVLPGSQASFCRGPLRLFKNYRTIHCSDWAKNDFVFTTEQNHSFRRTMRSIVLCAHVRVCTKAQVVEVSQILGGPIRASSKAIILFFDLSSLKEISSMWGIPFSSGIALGPQASSAFSSASHCKTSIMFANKCKSVVARFSS